MYYYASTGSEECYACVNLGAVAEFPNNFSSEELWDGIVKKVGEKEAESCFGAWAGMRLNPISGKDPITGKPEPKFVPICYGGFCHMPGRFVGYVHGVARTLGGPVCLWGDSESPDAEFTSTQATDREVLFSVCEANGTFWLRKVPDNGHLNLADAMGVKFEELLIA